MNLKDLAYFVALVEEGSFTKAAARMGVSQPTLSTQVKRLEQDLGASLVERSTQKLILTPAGKEVAKRAEDIVLAASDLEHAAAAQSDPGASEITLGISRRCASIFWRICCRCCVGSVRVCGCVLWNAVPRC